MEKKLIHSITLFESSKQIDGTSLFDLLSHHFSGFSTNSFQEPSSEFRQRGIKVVTLGTQFTNSLTCTNATWLWMIKDFEPISWQLSNQKSCQNLLVRIGVSYRVTVFGKIFTQVGCAKYHRLKTMGCNVSVLKLKGFKVHLAVRLHLFIIPEPM